MKKIRNILHYFSQRKALREEVRQIAPNTTYTTFPKLSPLIRTILALPDETIDSIQQLLQANSSAELIEQIQLHPLLLTEEFMATIGNILEESRQPSHDEMAEALQERYEILKRIIERNNSDLASSEMTNLLRKWINANSWEESYEIFVANIKKLSSKEALEAMNNLFAWNRSEEVQTLLKRHRAIVEGALVGQIDIDIYADLLPPSNDDLIDVLLGASTPMEVRRKVAQYPLFLEEERLQKLIVFSNEMEREGKRAVALAVRLRLQEVQHLCQTELVVRQPSKELFLQEEDGHVSIKAEKGGIAVKENSGTINLLNIEHYELHKKWQGSVVQGFKEHKAFVGRQQELETLRQYLATGENVAITGSVTLQGMGGIGKTYLARKLLVELQEQFQGRCIWVTLGPATRDYVSAQRVLRELAKCAFDGLVPPTETGQLEPTTVASWLDEMAPPGQLLVILDDIWHTAALDIIERALPTRSVKLITTRNADIATQAGGKKLSLEKLSLQDGMALLLNRLGNIDDPSDLAKLEQLVQLLEGHALALDIAAALIKKPARLQTILNKLQKEIGRGALAILKLGESEERETNLEKSLALSYEIMNRELKSQFRALGVFGAGTAITPEMAGAVWNMEDLDAVKKALFELEDLALLTQTMEVEGFSYRQHELLRVYAHALLEQADEFISVSWAHARYFTEQVMDHTNADNALLDQHIPNILAALQWAGDNEPILQALLLSVSFRFLFARGHTTLLESYLPQAIEASMDNPLRQAFLLKDSGDVAGLLGNLDQVRTHYNAALTLFRKANNHSREAELLHGLGDLEYRLGNLDQARAHYDAALRLESDSLGKANILRSLGDLEGRLGNPEQARTHYNAALPLFRKGLDIHGEANLLWSLGYLEYHLGNLDQARAHYDAALPLFREARHRLGEANLLWSLGTLEYRLSNLEQTRAYYDAALPLFHEIRHRLGEANCLRSLGDLEARLGNQKQARAHYDAALPIYRIEHEPLGEASILRSLGDLEARLDNQKQARAHYDAALLLFRKIHDIHGEANLLHSLGDLEARLSNLAQARTHYDAALTLYRLEAHHLGEANIYRSIASMFIKQKDWLQAQEYCEQALPLYIAEREPLGQTATLSYLGRAQFELGYYQQGIDNIRNAAELFKHIQDKNGEKEAEDDLFEMQMRLRASSDAGGNKVPLNAENWKPFYILLHFWAGDKKARLQILEEHKDLLLSTSIEPLFGPLGKIFENDAHYVEQIHHVVEQIRHCRNWGIEIGKFFIASMWLGNNIAIPAQYEDTVKQIATLRSQQQEESLVESIGIMQTLLDRLTADTSVLFEAALLCDLAKALAILPNDHPLRLIEQIGTYYREALPIYQDAGHSEMVTFIQEALTGLDGSTALSNAIAPRGELQ